VGAQWPSQGLVDVQSGHAVWLSTVTNPCKIRQNPVEGRRPKWARNDPPKG